jgi:hypothetical protein
MIFLWYMINILLKLYITFFATLMTSNDKIQNYKFVNLIESYNFCIQSIYIHDTIYKLEGWALSLTCGSHLSDLCEYWIHMARHLPGRINARSNLDETWTNYRGPKIHFSTLGYLCNTSRQLQGITVNFPHICTRTLTAYNCMHTLTLPILTS